MNLKQSLRNNFVAGFLVLLPSGVTILVLWFVFSRLGPKLVDFSLQIMPQQVEDYFQEMKWARAGWTGLIILAGIFLVILVGMMARNVIGRKLIGFGERIIGRIPVVKWVYVTVQKMSQALLGEKEGMFKRVALVEFPRQGLYSVGFITSRLEKGVPRDRKNTYVNIFIPTTPNPTNGYLIIVPEKEVIPLDLSVEEAMRFIISGGSVPPPLREIGASSFSQQEKIQTRE